MTWYLTEVEDSKPPKPLSYDLTSDSADDVGQLLDIFHDKVKNNSTIAPSTRLSHWPLRQYPGGLLEGGAELAQGRVWHGVPGWACETHPGPRFGEGGVDVHVAEAQRSAPGTRESTETITGILEV